MADINNKPINTDTAKRIGGIAGAGMPGKMAQRAVEAAANPYITNKAEGMARARRLKEIKKRRAAGARGKASAPKKMTGPGFYMVVGIAIVKDLLDVFLNVSVVLSVVVIATGLLISFIVAFYLFYVGVKPSAKKVAVYAVSAIIELIPFLSIIPTFAFTLFIIRALENNPKLKKMTGKFGK